jgi:hypothetical protein
MVLTPKELTNNQFKFHHTPQPPPTQKNINCLANADYFNRPTSLPNKMAFNNENINRGPKTPIPP